nr:T-cell-specific guanine nucleotide triphosphate-binding protein 1-like isoform X1 [Cavia porcellus]
MRKNNQGASHFPCLAVALLPGRAPSVSLSCPCRVRALSSGLLPSLLLLRFLPEEGRAWGGFSPQLLSQGAVFLCAEPGPDLHCPGRTGVDSRASPHPAHSDLLGDIQKSSTLTPQTCFLQGPVPGLLTAMGQASSSSTNPATGENGDLASSFDEYFKNITMETKILTNKDQDMIKLYLQQGDVQKAASVINAVLKDIENAPLSIAVTGEGGSGKSTLINALRGVAHEDEGAAATGLTETTTEGTEYRHPKFPNVSIWDLPGVGTTKFSPEKYLKKVNFADYDLFLIVSCTRFKNNDAHLAKAIAKMKKKFYFVRTKIDIDLSNEERAKPRNFNKEKLLEKLRNDIVTQLKAVGVSAAQIFLISSFDVGDYDFPEMEKTLLRDLPAHKRHVFRMSLPSLTEPAINQKTDSLKQKIWLEALKVGATATVPLVGLFSDSERKKLEDTLGLYRSHFGLDDESLEKMPQDLHVSVEDLKANLQYPSLVSAESNESFSEKMMQIVQTVLSVTGGPIATGLYFTKAFYIHNYFLDTVANDANVLLNKEDLFGASAGSVEGYQE